MQCSWTVSEHHRLSLLLKSLILMQRWLILVQSWVETSHGHQLVMGTLLNNSSVLNDTNQISVLNSGQPMRNHQASSARSSQVQCWLYNLSTQYIKGNAKTYFHPSISRNASMGNDGFFFFDCWEKEVVHDGVKYLLKTIYIYINLMSCVRFCYVINAGC